MMLHAFQTDRTFRHDTFPAFPLTISLRMTHDTETTTGGRVGPAPRPYFT
jgi:hypothetical protein